MKPRFNIPLFTLSLITILLMLFAGSSHAHDGQSHEVIINGNRDASCGAPDVIIDRDDDDFELEECLIWTFDYEGTEKQLTLYWTETNGNPNDRLMSVDSTGDGTTDLSPEDMVEILAQWTEEAWRAYKDYGYNDPLSRNDINVHILHSNSLLGWCCGGDTNHYFYHAGHLMNTVQFGGDAKDGQSVAYHEMWHASQYSWNKNTCFTNEGTASFMTDQVNLAVDIDDNNDYIGKVRGYLSGGDASRSLTRRLCYTGALFWKYFTEQIGTTATEPQVGNDIFKQFWDDLNPFDDSVTTLPTVDSVTRTATSNTRDLDSLWVDFAVANYAKDLADASLPTKYRYIDEQQTDAPDYPPVRLDLDFALTNSGSGVIDTTHVEPWATRYYQFRPANDVPFINLDMSEDAGAPLTWVLLLIKDDQLVSEERHVGPDFRRSFANDEYDFVTIVVVAHEHFGNFRYSVNGTQPTLGIVDPVRGRAAEAGDRTDPDKIVVRIEVLSPTGGGTPIEGIDAADFTITIGTQVVPTSDYVSTAYIAGQYWLLIQAPTQTSSGFKNLRVDYATLSDTELSAINYQPDIPTDNVVIIDKSGSMLGDPLQAAKDAGKLYVDSYESGDGMGVIAYNSSADRIIRLSNWSTTLRGQAHDAIDLISAGGGTSIGGALIAGMDELATRGLGNVQWTIVLLSDGINTTGSTINDFISAYRDRRDDDDTVPRVHTIALGPSADRAEMQRIAEETGGTYSYASSPSLRSADEMALLDAAEIDPSRVASVPLDATAFLELSEVYRVVAETVTHEQQIYFATGTFPYNSDDAHTMPVDVGADELTVIVKWIDAGTDSLAPVLRNPSGISVGDCTLKTGAHCLWRVNNPATGNWVVDVDPFSGSEFPPSDYMVEASVKSDLEMSVFLGLDHDERIAGQKLPILATLAHNAPVTGASVRAFITRPDGSSAATVILRDDGDHGDGAANDGIYGAWFNDTYHSGSFKVVITATGSTPSTGSYARRVRTAFHMAFASDGDQDGIPTWWENENGSNPLSNDANSDDDYDGLSLLGEFQNGTNPNDPDTDDGGEGDGSEVNTGGRPLDPSDDLTPCIPDFQVTQTISRADSQNGSAGIKLIYEVAPDHVSFTFWRAGSPTSSRTELASGIQPTGLYTDMANLVDGKEYYYWIQARDASGYESCILGPRGILYNATDAQPPEGYVQINNSQAETTSAKVTLQLGVDDAAEMLISNSADFSGAAWEPYTTSKVWDISSRRAANREAVFVFVKYRDASGNESLPISDSIILDSTPTNITLSAADSATTNLVPWVLVGILLIMASVAFARRR